MDEPVLIVAFNRPDHLSVLLDRLRQVRPTVVYAAIDGPRSDRDDEPRVRRCQELIRGIDWPCEVRTQFQETNLGCGRGVTAAISWFFDQQERGIILEDDVIPEPSFFDFAVELLDRYQDDDRVFSITGCNLVPPEAMSRPQDPYRFAAIPNVWGWATWRRSWAGHRLDARGWWRRVTLHRLLAASGYRPSGLAFWASTMEITARGGVDTWDWQLMFEAVRTGRLVATPNVNLVRNIGFDEQATHTKQRELDFPAPGQVELPTTPVPVRVDAKADTWMRRNLYRMSVIGSLDRMRRFALDRSAAP